MARQKPRSQRIKRQIPAPKPAKRGRFVWLTVCLAGIAAVSATAGALLAVALATTPLRQSDLTAEEQQVFGGEMTSVDNLRFPKLTRPVNILFLGIKVVSSEVNNPPPEVQGLGYHALVNSFEGLSDTMLLFHFNPRTKQVALLSIPRDTRTEVGSYGVTKINEANLYGGPALSARSVSYLLNDIQIDRYVRLNVQGVEKLIDALGGVTVTVPQDMKYTDESQHLYIDLKAGKQKLNGAQAMQFLRFRYDDNGDIGRVQRQQMLMRALLDQALSPTTIAKLPKVLRVIQSHLDTNLKIEELVALLGFASQVNRSDLHMLMLPGEFSAPDQYAASYWLPHYNAISDMVDQYFGSDFNVSASYLSPYQLKIAIQDGTGETVQLTPFQELLDGGGFTNSYVIEDAQEPLKVTRILAQRGDQSSAKEIRRHLGFGEVQVESTGALESDITIQLGQDWLQEVQ